MPARRSGLLKFDFLVLHQPEHPGRCGRANRLHRSEEIDVDNLALDDAKTFELLLPAKRRGASSSKDRACGAMSSSRADRGARPGRQVALFRPGPMATFPPYIRRKHGEEPVTHLSVAGPALQGTCTGSSFTRKTSRPRRSPWPTTPAPRRTTCATPSARRRRTSSASTRRNSRRAPAARASPRR